MGRHNSRRELMLHLGNLLALASIAMASSMSSSLSLSNFQLITSAAVPIGCILAYNSPIQGCTTSDFTQGRTCSTACIQGLQNIEEILMSVCESVNAPPSSVLGQALMGNLVEILCPSSRFSGTTSAIPTTTITTTTTTAAAAATTTSRRVGTFTVIGPPPTITSTLRTSTTTTVKYDTDTDTAATSATTSSSRTQIVVDTTATATGARPTQTTGAQPTQAPPQSTSDGRPGGGSPFDFASTSAASRQSIKQRWLESFLFANVFVLLLLR